MNRDWAITYRMIISVILTVHSQSGGRCFSISCFWRTGMSPWNGSGTASEFRHHLSAPHLAQKCKIFQHDPCDNRDDEKCKKGECNRNDLLSLKGWRKSVIFREGVFMKWLHPHVEVKVTLLPPTNSRKFTADMFRLAGRTRLPLPWIWWQTGTPDFPELRQPSRL